MTDELPLSAQTIEEDEMAAQLKRERRSLNLDPDLVAHNTSEHWAFAVKSCFRSAVDIQWTILQKNKVKRNAWTQGQNYAFAQGDTLYDTIEGYEPWLVALQKITTCLTVKSARPATPNEGVLGEVVFLAQHPSEDRRALESGGIHKGTQADFVELLRTGIFKGTHHSAL